MGLTFSSGLIGIFFSLLAAVFLGLYPVPRRYVDFGINDYMISMTIGVMISSSILSMLFFVFSENAGILGLSAVQWGLALLAGIIWTSGAVLYVSSVDCVGVGRATPFKNFSVVVGLLIGLIGFQEYQELTVLKVLLIILGSTAIVFAGKTLGYIEGRVDLSRPTCPVDSIIPEFFGEERKTPLIAGGVLALGAATLYGLMLAPVRMLTSSTDNVFQFLPAVGIGAFLTAVTADRFLTTRHTWLRVPVNEHFIAMFSGLLWVIAFTGLAIGLKLAKISIAWPIVKSSTVFAVLYGVFAKEISFDENKEKILQGILLGILGVILVGLSR